MLTMTELNALYVEKLQATGSHDAALLKVCWAAYQQGHADAVAGRPEQTPKGSGCLARQYSDQMVCHQCDLRWDMNDPCPPTCDDGWIPWKGGTCPLDEGVIVAIKLRDDPSKLRPAPASYWRWEHSCAPDDIVAYRVVQP